MFGLIKSKVIAALIVIVLALGAVIYYQQNKIVQTMQLYTVAKANEKAATRATEKWVDKYGKEHTRNIQFQNTVEELQHSNNTLDQYLTNTIKDSKVKKKNITQVGVITTEIDTLFQTDTLFSVPDTTIDLSDQYITNVISFDKGTLKSQVGVTDTLSLLWHSKKETVNPPKKFFLWRWFQKRHELIMIDTKHSNPRVKTGEQKFILTDKNKKE